MGPNSITRVVGRLVKHPGWREARGTAFPAMRSGILPVAQGIICANIVFSLCAVASAGYRTMCALLTGGRRTERLAHPAGQMPKFPVCIPAYHRAALWRPLLDSVASRRSGAVEIVIHEAGHGLPFGDVFYLLQFLEHFYETDGKRFLRESLRLLRPDGMIRVLLLDLDYLIGAYRCGHKRPMLENYSCGASTRRKRPLRRRLGSSSIRWVALCGPYSSTSYSSSGCDRGSWSATDATCCSRLAAPCVGDRQCLP